MEEPALPGGWLVQGPGAGRLLSAAPRRLQRRRRRLAGLRQQRVSLAAQDGLAQRAAGCARGEGRELREVVSGAGAGGAKGAGQLAFHVPAKPAERPGAARGPRKPRAATAAAIVRLCARSGQSRTRRRPGSSRRTRTTSDYRRRERAKGAATPAVPSAQRLTSGQCGRLTRALIGLQLHSCNGPPSASLHLSARSCSPGLPSPLGSSSHTGEWPQPRLCPAGVSKAQHASRGAGAGPQQPCRPQPPPAAARSCPLRQLLHLL